MPKKFTLIFDYDDFLQQKKRPPIFTNQRAHDVTLIFFIKLTLDLQRQTETEIEMVNLQ